MKNISETTITVFGATRGTGKEVVKQALAEGYQVKAFARSPEKLSELKHQNLNIIKGDVREREKVFEAVKGADAVISTLKHTKKGDEGSIATGTNYVIEAMKQYGISRLINMTGAGVKSPKDDRAPSDKIIGFLLKLMAGKLLKDSEDQASIIKSSNLNWTIVRAPFLVDGERKGDYQTGYFTMGFGKKISRADVADFMLKQIHQKNYLHELPFIAYK